MTLDSDGVAGPSPMQSLAFALAGCMAMDVVHILKKGRHELHGLRVDLSGARAPDNPKRFTAFTLHFTVNGGDSGRRDPARHRPVTADLLLGVALAAAGHPSQPRTRCPPATDAAARRRRCPPRRRRTASRISRLAARPRRHHHDHGAHPRQLDAVRRPPFRAVRRRHDRRRHGRTALPLSRRRVGVAVGRLEAASDVRSQLSRRPRSCDAVSRSSVSRSCSASRPASSAGVRGGRCSRSTSSTSWDRASWRQRRCGGGAARVAAAALRSRLPHLAIAFVTPPVRAVAWLSPLPDPIEGYIRPRPGFTNFAFFPVGGICLCRRSARRPARRRHARSAERTTRHSHCACRHR